MALREAVAAGDDNACRIAELQNRLLSLTGKANKTERNQLNRELWSLTQQQQQQPQMQQLQMQQMQQSPKQLIDHWRILHGQEADVQLMASCVRCGNGSAGLCRFHPDAKAFAFGTGRFDYAYTSAWDTPHDWWFCCGNPTATCEGCVEEPLHTVDPDWWRRYAGAAPALDAGATEDEDEELDGEGEGESGESEEMEVGMAAMEIG